MRKRDPTLQNSTTKPAKLAAKPPSLGALLFESWRRGLRFLKVFLRDFRTQATTSFLRQSRRSLLDVGLIDQGKLISKTPPGKNKTGEGGTLRAPPTPSFARERVAYQFVLID